MPIYRHCTGCGRGYDQKIWQKESFCGSCGEPLKTSLRRDQPLHADPYPDAPPKSVNVSLAVGGMVDQLCQFAKEHPFLFSAGALVAGAGAIMLGPSLITLGKGVMVIGGILVATGMLSVLYVEKEQAEKWISAGLLTLIAGFGIALIGLALTAAGIVAIVGGTGVATKATVEEILKRRITKQMEGKSIVELIELSKQLN
jgi:hypothetical protein